MKAIDNLKYCSQCKKWQLIDNFHNSKCQKDGLCNLCKTCTSINSKKRYIINKDKIDIRNRNYNKNRRKKQPWFFVLEGIQRRCNNKQFKAYKYYGGRGIKCLITIEELKELWFRDKAYEMKRPSIDRIDNNENYEYDNCQFIEQSENSTKMNIEHHKRKLILQYDLNGNFIREWESIELASKSTNINRNGITGCAIGRYKQSGGFIWKYK